MTRRVALLRQGWLVGCLLALAACAIAPRPAATPMVHRAATPTGAAAEATATPDPDETAVPTPDSRPATAVPEGVVVLALESAPGAKDFSYATASLEAPAGSKITLTFRNKTNPKDEVGHNWVLVKPGQENTVIANSVAAGDANDWLQKDDPGIIVATRLIEGNEEDTISFDAPAPGTYTFLSTFPENYAGGMKGTLTITGQAVAAALPAATTAPAALAPPGKNFEDFDPATFNNPTQIDHPLFSLKPGMQFTYEGQTDHDGKMVPHQLVVTISDLTKTIGGIPVVVAWDRDFANGELVEAELAFYAQDDGGTVWLMGEYPEEYDKGKLLKAPAWIHGFEDAHAGVIMPAKPVSGSASYSQGWGPAVGWTDRGQVHETGARTCVPVACYDGVVVIAETSATETGAYQLKFFAPGAGNIRVDWLGTDVTQENSSWSRSRNWAPRPWKKCASRRWRLRNTPMTPPIAPMQKPRRWWRPGRPQRPPQPPPARQSAAWWRTLCSRSSSKPRIFWIWRRQATGARSMPRWR